MSRPSSRRSPAGAGWLVLCAWLWTLPAAASSFNVFLGSGSGTSNPVGPVSAHVLETSTGIPIATHDISFSVANLLHTGPGNFSAPIAGPRDLTLIPGALGPLGIPSTVTLAVGANLGIDTLGTGEGIEIELAVLLAQLGVPLGAPSSAPGVTFSGTDFDVVWNADLGGGIESYTLHGEVAGGVTFQNVAASLASGDYFHLTADLGLDPLQNWNSRQSLFNLSLTAQLVPEPETFALVLLGLLIMLASRPRIGPLGWIRTAKKRL